jgi:hypothetical protein
MKELHWVYRITMPGLYCGTLAAFVAAITFLFFAIHDGERRAWIVLAMGFWGVVAVSQLWERCDRYEKLLRAKGIDPLDAYTESP